MTYVFHEFIYILTNLLYRNYTNRALKAFAKTTLEDSAASPTSYDAQEKHPISLFVRGDLKKREQLIQHPHVESFLFVSHDKLYELFCPKLVTTFDLSNPTDTNTTLGGVIGTNLAELTTLSFSADQAFGATYVVVTECASLFPTGKTLPETIYSSKPDDGKPEAPSSHPLNVSMIPLFLPKIKGHKIKTGDIRRPVVLQSLSNYHPMARLWIDNIIAMRKTSSSVKNIPREFIPTLPTDISAKRKASSPITVEFDKTSPVFVAVDAMVRPLKDQCLTDIVEDEPQAPPITPSLMYRTPSRSGFLSPQSSVTPMSMEATSVVAKDKNKFSLQFYRLFLSGVWKNEGVETLVLGNISDDFMEALNCPSKLESVKIFTSAFTTYLRSRADSENWLDTYLNFPHANRALISVILCCEYHALPLDEESELLSQRVSILNFLQPPKKGNDEEYQRHVRKSQETHMELAVDESIEKRSAIDKKVFLNGRQDTYHDAVTALSNFVVFLDFITDENNTSEKPVIIDMLRKLGKLLVSQRFRALSEKLEYTTPWFTHSLICQVQAIINTFVDVAQNWSYQKRVERNSTLDSSILSKCFRDFHVIFDGIEGAMNNSSSSLIFNVRPLSFRQKKRPPSDNTDSSYKKQKSSPASNGRPTPGWITSSGSFKFPENLGLNVCKFFALVGKECDRPRNTCPYEHRSYPRGFNRTQQAVLCKWVKENNNVEWADHIKQNDRNFVVSNRSTTSTSTSHSATGNSNTSSSRNNNDTTPIAQGTTPSISSNNENENNEANQNSSESGN